MQTILLLISTAIAADDGSCYAWLPAEIVASVENKELVEISGLVASRQHANILWGHNDAGNVASLYAIGTDGADMGTFFVPGAENVDWEDIAIGPCAPGAEECGCLYIADIGSKTMSDHISRATSVKNCLNVLI